LKRCPDGSCRSKSCGTPVTCSKDAPYKCFDNTCKNDPRDCLEMPICTGDTPILCHGKCVSKRVDCKSFDSCPVDKPVRCPDFNCYESVNDCAPI